jgi:hypothetical protein
VSRLHQPRERPALGRLPGEDDRPQHVDGVEGDAGLAHPEDPVGDADPIDGDDRDAVLLEAHAVEDDAGEEVAADARDRDLRVEQPLGAGDDVAAQPVAEPPGLRDAEQPEHEQHQQHGRAEQQTAQPAPPAAGRPRPVRLERRRRRVAQAHDAIILQPLTKCTAKRPARR